MPRDSESSAGNFHVSVVVQRADFAAGGSRRVARLVPTCCQFQCPLVLALEHAYRAIYLVHTSLLALVTDAENYVGL